MGSNLPMTRTPDAHFASEHKYNGGKIVNLAPNYSDITKFADLWVPTRPGTDAAFILACIHVILKEYHIDKTNNYFHEYLKQYTNLPFLVILDEGNADAGGHVSGRFLRASDFAEFAEEENADWKLPVIDRAGELAVTRRVTWAFAGTRRNRGRWNLKSEDATSGEAFDPLLDVHRRRLPRKFRSSSRISPTPSTELGTTPGKGKAVGTCVARRAEPNGHDSGRQEVRVTTAFDLLLAQFGVGRGLSGEYPSDYDDASTAPTRRHGRSRRPASTGPWSYAWRASGPRTASQDKGQMPVHHRLGRPALVSRRLSLIYRAQAVMGII